MASNCGAFTSKIGMIAEEIESHGVRGCVSVCVHDVRTWKRIRDRQLDDDSDDDSSGAGGDDDGPDNRCS